MIKEKRSKKRKEKAIARQELDALLKKAAIDKRNETKNRIISTGVRRAMPVARKASKKKKVEKKIVKSESQIAFMKFLGEDFAAMSGEAEAREKAK